MVFKGIEEEQKPKDSTDYVSCLYVDGLKRPVGQGLKEFAIALLFQLSHKARCKFLCLIPLYSNKIGVDLA